MINRIMWLMLINLIIYRKTIYFGYVGDDIEVSTHKADSFKTRWHRYWGTFIGSYHKNSLQAHFITLLVHAAVCILIYLVFGADNVSFLAAVLFSINPVNMQCSVWISGRNYATASILTLLMFAFPPLSIIPYYFTSFFAVNAWFAPCAFLWTPWWWLVFMIPIVFFVFKKNKTILHTKLWENSAGTKTTNTEMRAVKPDKIIVFIKTYGYYFRLCLIPWKLGVEHKFLYGFGTNQTDNKIGYKLDGNFWIGIFCMMIPLTALFFGYRAVGMGLLWFSVNIAMWCNFITIQQQISLRYTYLANIGMMYALAHIIYPYSFLISAFIVFYLTRLWWTMPSYLSDYWVVEYGIAEEKNFHYLFLMRGVKKYFAKDFPGAFYDFNEAYLQKPYDFKILFNLATVLVILGNIKKSREFMQKAKENIYDEMEEDVKNQIASIEKLQDSVEEQLKTGVKAVQIDLNNLIVVK